jgi:N-acetyl-anhydromuramoyl-L-alanine amidase
MVWRAEGWLDGAECLPSPNFGERPVGEAVSLIVVHNISLPPNQFGGNWVEKFFLNQLDPLAHPYFATIVDAQVSAHFYVRRDGRLIQFVGCDNRAWHAGRSQWCERANCNDYSVGIELEGCDDQPFTAAQYVALWRVVDALCWRYPVAAIVGHSDIAPGRKTDPGLCFDWLAVRDRYPTLRLPAEVAS